MAHRNMEETINKVKGSIPINYDLKVEEWFKIVDVAQVDVYSAISMAFDYGFVLGARAQKTGKYAENNSRRA